MPREGASQYIIFMFLKRICISACLDIKIYAVDLNKKSARFHIHQPRIEC